LAKHIPYEENHREIDGILEKKCSRHHIYFPDEDSWMLCNLDNFYKNDKNKIDGLFPWCKKCAIKFAGINQIKNRERSYSQHKKYRTTKKYDLWADKHFIEQRDSGYSSQYRKDHPELMKYYASLHRIHDITKNEWKETLKIFEHRCCYCGLTEKESLEKYEEVLHKDHADHEGANDISNALPACKGCNSSKHQDSIEEWYPKQKFYKESNYNRIIWWLIEGYLNVIEEKPPYRIIRKQNEDGKSYHHELWTVDKFRNIIECIGIDKSKKNLMRIINEEFNIVIRT
jgi:hypothetical protein